MTPNFVLYELYPDKSLRVRPARLHCASGEAMRNLITDVEGVRVGHAVDARAATGVTVALFDRPAAAAMAALGGAPGSRDTLLLEPEMTVSHVDALVLSGGSAFGLDAAGGVQAVLTERGRGFEVGAVRVPIVPQAILFDLLNGGDKGWGRAPPYFRLGIEAVEAADIPFALGSAGAGHGATTLNLKGGLGSASARLASGITVGALAAVNAAGSAVMGDGPWFWAGPYEQDGEFGARGWPRTLPDGALAPRLKGRQGAHTTIAIVATDAALSGGEVKRIAIAAHDGLARALRPAHTPLDGDLVFAAATQQRPLTNGVLELAEIGLAAADCLARAIARAVYEATPLPFPGALPSWRQRFG
jgi:L-aminopeptidase/D-esterase-like protein